MTRNEVSQATGLPRATGLRRLVAAGKNSVAGLVTAFRNEAAFRQEVFLCCILLPLACWLDVSKVERLFLIFSVALVPIVELLNSAVEAAIDRISYELHPLSKAAKDIGSAAVLLALLNMLVVWWVVLY